MRSLVPLVLLGFLAGCPSAKSDAAADAGRSTSAADAGTAPVATAPAPTPTPPGAVPVFIKIPRLVAGPVVATGYPHEVRNGMNDPAKWAGFSKDGSVFGYCGEGGGITSARCEFVDRAGKSTVMKSTEGDGTPAEVAKRKTIDAFITSNAIPVLKLDPDPTKAKPPALSGAWPYTDITIDIVRGASVLKVGGTVKGEASPVHPITIGSPNAGKSPASFVAMNLAALGPGGNDLGFVGTFFAGEFSDVFAVKRMSAGSFASLVYNDTGFRYHQKNDFVKSSDLFARAVAADPSAKLPAYNLACAWGRLKEPRTKDALAFAIERDPAVKTRAKTDKDFDLVKTEPWFADLTK